jgi:hypothetical protein
MTSLIPIDQTSALCSFIRFYRTLRSRLRRLFDAPPSLPSPRENGKIASELRRYCAMSDISASILRVSMNVIAFAVKGNQNGIVQQQIETMGLRQWLSLVAAWIIDSIHADIVKLHTFIRPQLRALYLKSLTARPAVPTPIYLF